MVGYYSQGVPSSVELENNSNQKKYTVNRSPKGDLLISRPACALFVMGALLLAAVAAVITFFLLPRCDTSSTPEAFREAPSVSKREPTVKYVRLPRSIEPTHYRLFITPELQGNFTTNGNVTIKLSVKEDTNKIVFNANDLDIDEHSTSLQQVNGTKTITINKQYLDADKQIYTMELDEWLEEGGEYELEMKFSGFLNDYMVGFYRSQYTAPVNDTRWIASTQFSPIDARRAFPCFDEPSFKSKYSINIARPSNMSTLSNMNKRTSVILSNNLSWDIYEETPRMSSYLVAFIVHDFVPYKEQIFTIWTRSDRIQEAVFATTLGRKVLNYFEDYFQIKFPLPKLDIVAIPDFGFSAMENWGLITFKEQTLLFDEKSSTVNNKRSTALIMSHELAHQWFGNLVTPHWWDDLWLKEGFSTYFEYLGTNHAEPTWKILDEFQLSTTMEAFDIDRLASSRAIYFKVKTVNDIRQAFDAISYSKGAALVRMMANFLGGKTFKTGLQNFLKKHQYSNVTHNDLWDSLTEQAYADGVLSENETVKDIMSTWVEQAGFPVVTAVANYQDNTLNLTQKRFLLSGKYEGEEKWWIPISLTTANNATFDNNRPKIWLRNQQEATVNVDFGNRWYLLNLKQSGYYIVNYDETNWRSLLANVQLFPPLVRAQLVGDAMELARAGLLDYDIPLRFISRIGRQDKDITFVPFYTIFKKITFLYDILYFTPIFGAFENFVWTSFNFAFESVLLTESSSDTYIQQRIRRLILEWSCKKQDSRCTVSSRHMYRNWMTQKQIITPNIREVVSCTAIREGGEPEWNFAYNEFLTTTSPSDKDILRQALGCSSKPWILSKYLHLMLKNDSGFRKQDGADVFTAVANNPIGYTIAFDFLRSNWKKIIEHYGDAFRTISVMADALYPYMNTMHQLKQIEVFMEEHKVNLSTSAQAFNHTIEIVKSNIAWMETNYKSIETWLKTQSEHYGLNK